MDCCTPKDGHTQLCCVCLQAGKLINFSNSPRLRHIVRAWFLEYVHLKCGSFLCGQCLAMVRLCCGVGSSARGKELFRAYHYCRVMQLDGKSRDLILGHTRRHDSDDYKFMFVKRKLFVDPAEKLSFKDCRIEKNVSGSVVVDGEVTMRSGYSELPDYYED